MADRSYKWEPFFFDDYNANFYGSIWDWSQRKLFLKAIVGEAGIAPKLALSNDAVAAVAFARLDPKNKLTWVTVKTGAEAAQNVTLKVAAALLPRGELAHYPCARSSRRVRPAERLGKRSDANGACPFASGE